MMLGFYMTVGLVALWIIYKGWRGAYLTEALTGAGVLVAGFWLTGPDATDDHRWIIAGALGALAVRQIWKRRYSFWWPPLIAVATLLGLVVVYLTSPFVNGLFFELFMVKIFGFFLASFLCWVLVRAVLPRIVAKYQAPWVLVLSGVFSAGMFFAALAWWLEAVEINVYPKNPFVRTGADLQAEYEKAKGLLGYRGLFLVGRVGDVERVSSPESEGGSSHSDFVAYFDGGFTLSRRRETSYLPLFYTVQLEDGAKCVVQGINSVQQTFNWQEGGPHLWMRCLRHGDPVVVWGDPGQSVSMTDGALSWGLNMTRVIAFGSPESFMEDFVLSGVRTARMFGWIGFFCLFLSFLPLYVGFLYYRRLKLFGTDDAPPTGWKSPTQVVNEAKAAIKNRVEKRK